MTTATFIRRTALFRLGEHERGVVVRVKGDNRIKALALLALEAFQDFRLSGGQQFPDFIIGQIAACLQTEHGKSAFRIVATHHLPIELHPARAALGAGTAGVLMPEQLVA